MRFFIYTLIGMSVLTAGYFFFIHKNDEKSLHIASSIKPQPEEITPSKKAKALATIEQSAIFIPYWANMSDISQGNIQRLLYFGVTVDEKGVIASEPGYAGLQNFVSHKGAKQSYLTVRMLDADTNTEILKNSDSWKPIAESIALTAADNGFDGVVLDLEVGLVSFHINPDSITGFTQTVKDELEIQNLPLAMTLYGDNFYRKRPYDVQKVSNIADEIMIMAYDFHKSFGEAGPNFPLNGREKYGYDFTTMGGDFTQLIAPEKITVIFGMFGYEWIVDEQNRPLKSATALTLNEINAMLSPQCTRKDCKVTRDHASAETIITFTDDENRKHIIWYEDADSVSQKEKVLQQYGIGKIGYWAYGYL